MAQQPMFPDDKESFYMKLLKQLQGAVPSGQDVMSDIDKAAPGIMGPGPSLKQNLELMQGPPVLEQNRSPAYQRKASASGGGGGQGPSLNTPTLDRMVALPPMRDAGVTWGDPVGPGMGQPSPSPAPQGMAESLPARSMWMDPGLLPQSVSMHDEPIPSPSPSQVAPGGTISPEAKDKASDIPKLNSPDESKESWRMRELKDHQKAFDAWRNR